MVIDSFESGDCKQKRSLTRRHPRQPLGNQRTMRVKAEALNEVVVLTTIRKRYIQPMIPRMDCPV